MVAGHRESDRPGFPARPGDKEALAAEPDVQAGVESIREEGQRSHRRSDSVQDGRLGCDCARTTGRMTSTRTSC